MKKKSKFRFDISEYPRLSNLTHFTMDCAVYYNPCTCNLYTFEQQAWVTGHTASYLLVQTLFSSVTGELGYCLNQIPLGHKICVLNIAGNLVLADAESHRKVIPFTEDEFAFLARKESWFVENVGGYASVSLMTPDQVEMEAGRILTRPHVVYFETRSTSDYEDVIMTDGTISNEGNEAEVEPLAALVDESEVAEVEEEEPEEEEEEEEEELADGEDEE